MPKTNATTSRYGIQKMVRDLPANDRRELERFHEYLKDQDRLPADQLRAKWSDYEAGKDVRP